MTAMITVTITALLALPVGWTAVRSLRTLAYRRGDDEPTSEQPGDRWWVLTATALAATSLATTAVLSPQPLLFLPAVPLVATGGWLAAVDFDVMRLPNRILGPTSALSIVATLAVAVALQAPQIVMLAFLGATLAGGLFAVLHWVTRGGIGMGDVKLVALLGWIISPVSITLLMPALLVGSIGAWIWNTIRRNRGPLAYGPWLLLGAWLSVCTAPLVL